MTGRRGSSEYPGASRWNSVFADIKSSTSTAVLNMGAWYLMTQMVFYVCWMIMQAKRKTACSVMIRNIWGKLRHFYISKRFPSFFIWQTPTALSDGQKVIPQQHLTSSNVFNWTRFRLDLDQFLYYSQSDNFKWFITAKAYSYILASSFQVHDSPQHDTHKNRW